MMLDDGGSTEPPAALTMVAERVEARLGRLFVEQGDSWRRLDPRLAEAVDELGAVLTTGGKRLRAAFCYWGWYGRATADGSCAPTADDVVIDTGAAFELLQAFALIHDDVMDDSATRRGRPTVHVSQADRIGRNGWHGEPRRFGEGVAILLGDLSHAYADQLMAGSGPAARRIWGDLKIELNLGQYLDLRSSAAGELDEATARQVSTFKSALYTIVRPLQVGASLDGPADAALLDQLDRFGRPLGLAFQLKDDLLGVLGDSAQIGKPVGDDLREGKPTELVVLAMDRADPSQRAVLAGIGRRDLTADDVADIVAVFRATGAVDDISARIADLVADAKSALPDLPFGSEAEAALSALADYVAARNN